MEIFKRRKKMVYVALQTAKHTTDEVAYAMAKFALNIKCSTTDAEEAAVDAITEMTHATMAEAKAAVGRAWKRLYPNNADAQREYLKMCSNGIREYCDGKEKNAPCLFGFEGGCDMCVLQEEPQFWPDFKEGEEHV